MDFVEIVKKRLDELGLRPATAEKQFGLRDDAIRNIFRPSDSVKSRRPRLDTVEEICSALGIELYIGPPRDPAPETEVAGQRFATVARYDAQAAAGDGTLNLDGPPVDHLAFSKTWLTQNGIAPGACVLINAKGESMAPSIYDGDLVMIDRRRTEPRNGKIFVYTHPEDGTRIKRFQIIDGALIIRSDNPDQERFKPEIIIGEAMNGIAQNILGQVVWSGHKWA